MMYTNVPWRDYAILRVRSSWGCILFRHVFSLK